MSTYGATTQLSNRFNLFVSPGYLIDKEKMVYLKAGYSQVSVQEKRATSVTINANGKSTVLPTTTAGTYDNSTAGGYMIGLGYKQIITEGLYAFGEFNYMGYGTLKQGFTSNGNSASKSGEGFSNASTTNVSTSQNLTSFQILVGIGYAF